MGPLSGHMIILDPVLSIITLIFSLLNAVSRFQLPIPHIGLSPRSHQNVSSKYLMYAFSAPGKALIVGGYLVLDPQYSAYVTALLARIHAVASRRVPDPSQTTHTIQMLLPQFKDGNWSYSARLEAPQCTVESYGRYNPFAEAAVATVLSYVAPASPVSFSIVIYSDADYHAQLCDLIYLHSLDNGARQFPYHSKPIEQIPKTGLGLSAGLVTVIIASLLAHFRVSQGVDSLHLVHNLAQIAHCYAQKKVGLGFDVAAAVYGLIVYQRFAPELLQTLFVHDALRRDSTDTLSPESLADYSRQLRLLANSDWLFEYTPCELPPHIRLIIGDIQGGLSTPKLVLTVMSWRSAHPQLALEVYTALDAANRDVMAILSSLSLLYKENAQEYMLHVRDFLARSTRQETANNKAHNLKELTGKNESSLHNKCLQGESKSVNPIFQLRAAMSRVRAQLQRLLEYSGTDIEPPPQTRLLDACMSLEGCIGGAVPGAGGFDAICLLMIDLSAESLLEKSRIDDRFNHVMWLDLQEQSIGLCLENPEDYSGLSSKFPLDD